MGYMGLNATIDQESSDGQSRNRGFSVSLDGLEALIQER
jgi:hypothetical protein